MIDINRIQTIPKDNTLYLIEKLPFGTGLFVSNGNILYLVPNQERCASLSIKTDFLYLATNVYVSAFNASASSFENGYYNVVELYIFDSDETEDNISAFFNLCLSHASYMHGQEFMSFFDSLVALFQLPREQHYKNLIGLMGELMLIDYIQRNYNFDISPYWHINGPSSRLDFVCPFANFEVKTTTSESLHFHIKHDQLFTITEKNYLIAIILEESNSGCTLEEISSTLLESSDFCNSLHFSMNLEKEKRRVPPMDSKHKRFVIKKIHAYSAYNINPFREIPEYIEDLTYKLDLTVFPDIPIANILSAEYKCLNIVKR